MANRKPRKPPALPASSSPAPARESVGDATVALLDRDDLPDELRPSHDSRVLLIGLLWDGTTLLDLARVEPGGELRTSGRFDLAHAGLPRGFRLVRSAGTELVVTVPATLRAEVHADDRVCSLEESLLRGDAGRIDLPFRGAAYTVKLRDRIEIDLGPRLALILRYVRPAHARLAPAAASRDFAFRCSLLLGLLALIAFAVAAVRSPSTDDLIDPADRFALLVKYRVVPSRSRGSDPSTSRDVAKAELKRKESWAHGCPKGHVCAGLTGSDALSRVSGPPYGQSGLSKDVLSGLSSSIGLGGLGTRGTRSPPAARTLPSFQWPPPKASAQQEIPDKWLRTGPVRLKDISVKLEKALQLASYRPGEWSYYSIPGGFALATHLEQIEEDGTPLPGKDRWNPARRSLRSLSLAHFVAALAGAPEGIYRALVFVVTDQPLAQAELAPESETIKQWSSKGAASLPAEGFGRAPYTEEHRTWALIYQFRKSGAKQTAEVIVPSPLSGEEHLDKGGVWRPLSLL